MHGWRLEEEEEEEVAELKGGLADAEERVEGGCGSNRVHAFPASSTFVNVDCCGCFSNWDVDSIFFAATAVTVSSRLFFLRRSPALSFLSSSNLSQTFCK